MERKMLDEGTSQSENEHPESSTPITQQLTTPNAHSHTGTHMNLRQREQKINYVRQSLSMQVKRQGGSTGEMELFLKITQSSPDED